MPSQQTINPATGAVLATYELMSDADATAVVEAAHHAFGSWRRRTVTERAEVVRAIGALIEGRTAELATLMSQEMGKTVKQAQQEAGSCIEICGWTADHAAEFLADEERELAGGQALVTYQPVGVILGIQPWNFPMYQVIRYAVSSLVAGNTVLLKHAANVWGTALALEALFRDAGLPQDCFRVLLIDDDQTEALIGNPHVRGVTLTGSDRAGRAVAAKAAEHLKKTVLELGSNDAYLVLADADVDLAVKTCAMARTYNNGETCVAAKRFVVTDAVYEQFRDAFVERMAAITSGDPMEAGTKLGPIAREDLRDTLHEQVMDSVAAGATLALGGEVPDGPGWFYPSTVLEDVAPGMPAYDDELFGPVAALIRVADDDEAIRVANDSRYGLGGGIFSRDVEKATALARDHFDTGMVNINGYRLAQPNLPFGGVKDSGYGREHGPDGLREFVNVKAVMILG